MNTRKPIRKKGTILCKNIKSIPIVFKGVLYRFESVYYPASDDEPGYAVSHFVNTETGEISLSLTKEWEYPTVFVWQDKVYLFGVKNQSCIYMQESQDLRNWSTPVCVLGAAGWVVYNLSICRIEDGFMMALQFAEPLWFVIVPFTFFFAESKDLRKWRMNLDASFGRQNYVDTPMLRYSDGWFYLFYVAGTDDSGFKERVVRSRDLRNWIQSPYNPIMEPSAQDRAFSSKHLSLKEQHMIQTARNIDNSRLQMCANGKDLYLTYNWGDQGDNIFLGEAEVKDSTEQEFCSAFFE